MVLKVYCRNTCFQSRVCLMFTAGNSLSILGLLKVYSRGCSLSIQILLYVCFRNVCCPSTVWSIFSAIMFVVYPEFPPCLLQGYSSAIYSFVNVYCNYDSFYFIFTQRILQACSLSIQSLVNVCCMDVPCLSTVCSMFISGIFVVRLQFGQYLLQ